MSVFLDRQSVRRKRAWRRIFHRVEHALLSLAAVLVGVLLLYGVYALVFFGNWFTVREIVVEGRAAHTTAEQAAQIVGVKRGDNLFWFDVVGAQQRLAAEPWIKRATVSRRAPHTLWLHLEEHQPAAIVAHGSLFYVDADGEVFKELTPDDDKHYPVLTGMMVKAESGISAEQAEKTQRTRLKEALHIVAQFEHSNWMDGRAVAEVHYDAEQGFSLVTTEQPMQIVFGKENISDRLNLIEHMGRAIRERSGQIQYIIADDEKRVIVKYRQI